MRDDKGLNRIPKQALINMEAIENQAFVTISMDIDSAYQSYLQRNNLSDSPLLRLGFYNVMDHVIQGAAPFPIVRVHERVIKFLTNRQVEAIDPLVEPFEKLLTETIAAKYRS